MDYTKMSIDKMKSMLQSRISHRRNYINIKIENLNSVYFSRTGEKGSPVYEMYSSAIKDLKQELKALAMDQRLDKKLYANVLLCCYLEKEIKVKDHMLDMFFLGESQKELDELYEAEV